MLQFTETKTCVEFNSQQDMPVANPKKSRVEGYLYYKPGVWDWLRDSQSHHLQSCQLNFIEGISPNFIEWNQSQLYWMESVSMLFNGISLNFIE